MATEIKTNATPAAKSKLVTFTISCTVPVPAASSLGGNSANKGLSKIDRENRYFLNALIRRGATVVSEVEVK